jgi:hypothetical protein
VLVADGLRNSRRLPSLDGKAWLVGGDARGPLLSRPTAPVFRFAVSSGFCMLVHDGIGNLGQNNIN